MVWIVNYVKTFNSLINECKIVYNYHLISFFNISLFKWFEFVKFLIFIFYDFQKLFLKENSFIIFYKIIYMKIIINNIIINIL